MLQLGFLAFLARKEGHGYGEGCINVFSVYITCIYRLSYHIIYIYNVFMCVDMHIYEHTHIKN